MGKSDVDAYGHEIYDYFSGKNAQEIVEREDGFIGVNPDTIPSYFSTFKNWSSAEKVAIKFVRGKVLDIGCGAGRVEIYLQSLGIKVIGIDTSKLALKVCKQRGAKNVRNISIEGISKLKAEKFGTVVMFGSNFGLFGSFKRARKLLNKLHQITSADAIILAESNDPYKTDKPVHLAYQKLNRKRGRMGGQIKIRIRSNNFIGNWFDYLLVSQSEMKEILKGTGWKVQKFLKSSNSKYIAMIKKEY